jgi:hypothetical protein
MVSYGFNMDIDSKWIFSDTSSLVRNKSASSSSLESEERKLSVVTQETSHGDRLEVEASHRVREKAMLYLK